MVADPFFWEKAQKLNQWLFLQVGLSLCDRLTFAILCFGLLQLFSTVLSESEFFLYMNLASVSTGLIFVQLSDSWHWPMLEKFIYTIFMFPKTRWLIFILCIVILLSDNSISDGLQKWCGLLKMKLLAVVKCNLHTSIIWVLALVKMASFLVVVHLMGLLTGL